MNEVFPSSIENIHIYNASLVTRELLPAMLSAIRSVHPKPWKIEAVDKMELKNEKILYIIICPAGLAGNLDVLPKYYIVWQLEDMQGKYKTSNYLETLRRALYVWDYSVFNMKILKEKDNIDTIYAPPGFNCTVTITEILHGTYIYSDENKDIDILFLGYCVDIPRRQFIRDECYKTGLRIWFAHHLDVNGMKEAIKRAKVCINMLAAVPFVLAKVRLNLLLSNQACIVSEESCDKEADMLYDQIVSKTKELVGKPEIRKRNAIKGYQWYRNERNWTDIFDFNKHLPSLIG